MAPRFDDDETDELLRYIGSDLDFGVADYEELADGTIVIATHDDDADISWARGDEEVVEAIEDGDTWGVIHVDRRGEWLDSVWGYVGFGGAVHAIDAYVEEQGLDRTAYAKRWAAKRAKQRAKELERSGAREGIVFS